MSFISKSDSIESNRIPVLKKGYVRIFALGIILLIVGLIISTAAAYIPIETYNSINYDDYTFLMRRVSALSILIQKIGLLSMSVSTFVGAIVDKGLSGEVKKGMVIASSITILALSIISIFPMYI